MVIPEGEYADVILMNPDEHRALCSYGHWLEEFKENSYLYLKVQQIAKAFESGFTRGGLVDFYRSNVEAETKFIAAMMWGHAAPANGRRDSRGPWKLGKMFADVDAAEQVIRKVNLSSDEALVESYKALDRALHRCGPNFFTKHFYFLGKAKDLKEYPLIFDDRVARGIAKVSAGDKSALEVVRVSTQRTPEAYLRYLRLAHDAARAIGCAADQVEYYLFTR